MKPSEAVLLLVERFPFVANNEGDELKELLQEPYYAYGLLVAEVLRRSRDESLIDRVTKFIDELASSNDSLLEDLLVIELLEGIAQDAELTIRIKSRISVEASAYLDRVEREFYRREPGSS